MPDRPSSLDVVMIASSKRADSSWSAVLAGLHLAKMERGGGYLEFFGVCNSAEHLEGLDGTDAMGGCGTR